VEVERRPEAGQWGMLISCMGLVTVNVAGGIRDAAQVATSESEGIPYQSASCCSRAVQLWTASDNSCVINKTVVVRALLGHSNDTNYV